MMQISQKFRTLVYYEIILLDWCSELVLLNKNDVKDDLSVQFVQPSPLTIMMCLKIVDRFQKSDLSPLVPDSR